MNNKCQPRIFESIPLYFDSSLSYLEQLANLKNIMNEIINFANNELTDQLKQYIY